MLAGRRPRRVGDRLLAGEQERLVGQPAAAHVVHRAAQLGGGAADVHRAGAAGVLVLPRDRPIQRPVELHRLRPVAEAHRAAHVGVAERVGGERDEAVRGRRRDDRARGDLVAAGELDALDPPALREHAHRRRVHARLAAALVQGARQRPGDRARAALRARPADRVAEDVQPDTGDRAARAVQRRVAVQRRAVQPRRAVAVQDLAGEILRRHEQQADELQRAVELEGGQQAPPGERGKPGQHRRPQRVEVVQVRRDELLPALPVAGAERVERAHGVVEVLGERGAAPAGQRVDHRDLRLDPAQAVALELELLEHRRGDAGGMHGGEDVVLKAGQRQLGGLGGAAERRRSLDDEHRAPGAGQRDRRGQPVGPGADDDRVVARLAHGAAVRRAIWCSMLDSGRSSPQNACWALRPAER